MGEFGVSFHVCRRGMRDEADAWVEGMARSQRWGVLGLRQVGTIQASTGDKSSEGGWVSWRQFPRLQARDANRGRHVGRGSVWFQGRV